jgi:hypothetical protein
MTQRQIEHVNSDLSKKMVLCGLEMDLELQKNYTVGARVIHTAYTTRPKGTTLFCDKDTNVEGIDSKPWEPAVWEENDTSEE